MIDILVPVFNAPDDVRRCVESVLALTSAPYRLLLIDDASTDDGVRRFMDELARAAHPQVVLLANERNLGFIGTVNRGMQASHNDVVLLNSDTIVTRGWLDAIRRCATSDARIATITPFSNNAEICSFPRFCRDNPWDPGRDPEPVRAAIAAASVPSYPDLPTGVGFCMYIRRAAIDALGVFDHAFGRGYGEENDFCLRAAKAGLRNVLADDAFVVHLGSRSFGDAKREIGGRNLEVLSAKHPHYVEMVHRYIENDPLRPLREAAMARLRSRGPSRGVMHVIHGDGGGTERHVRGLIEASSQDWRHYLAIAADDRWTVEEHGLDSAVVRFVFERRAGESWQAFVEALCATFGIALLHLHNISGCREGFEEALRTLSIPFGYTIHDLGFACPTITFLDASGRYCGGVTDAVACGRCLHDQPAFADVDIERWRARHRSIVDEAAFLIAPSAWAANTFERYFAGATVHVVAHGTRAHSHPRTAGTRLGVVMPDDGMPVVAVIGAIGPDKGARRIERIVALARERDIALRIVVIGYTDVLHAPWQSDDSRLTVHGRYHPDDLPDLLAHYRVSLVLFPSEGPETFSYTLSEVWRAGMPVLVPPIGALAERVAGTHAGFVLTPEQWTEDAAMLREIVALTSTDARGKREAAARAARDIGHATLAAMTRETFALYDEALARTAMRPARDGFAPQRIRDALGYVRWAPPGWHVDARDTPNASDDHARTAGIWRRIARAARGLRRTGVGRVLYSVAPAPLIASLKARLGP